MSFFYLNSTTSDMKPHPPSHRIMAGVLLSETFHEFSIVDSPSSLEIALHNRGRCSRGPKIIILSRKWKLT
ncbi:hypothetical protein Y032_0573g170 [Ancylostoma ceylanicum]|uniref:Uncharacterized protein n=1 Tax=Ancylostoma ceylanicum TaxID=53326 RepID=A0A016WNE1_9BILA|nr:hypothetical protein Y032_0573g170 [Ancylostoma ceylanicum]